MLFWEWILRRHKILHANQLKGQKLHEGPKKMTPWTLLRLFWDWGFPLHKPYIQLIQVSTSILGTWKFCWIRLYSKFQPSFSVGSIKIPQDQDPRNLLYAPQKRRSKIMWILYPPTLKPSWTNEHKKPRVKGLLLDLHHSPKISRRKKKKPFLEFPITQPPTPTPTRCSGSAPSWNLTKKGLSCLKWWENGKNSKEEHDRKNSWKIMEVYTTLKYQSLHYFFLALPQTNPKPTPPKKKGTQTGPDPHHRRRVVPNAHSAAHFPLGFASGRWWPWHSHPRWDVATTCPWPRLILPTRKRWLKKEGTTLTKESGKI